MILLEGWPANVTWNMFQERSSKPSGVTYNAQISPKFDVLDVHVDESGGRFKVSGLKIRVRVEKTESWVVTSQKSAKLLNHEQGHFDILGLVARELKDEVEHASADSKTELIRQLRNLMAEKQGRADEIDDEYDSESETDHGRKQRQQDQWDKKIKEAKANNTNL